MYKSISIFLLLFASLLLSCSNEEDSTNLNETPISFNTSISEGSGVQTRASKTLWSTTDEVGIFMTTDTYGALTYGNNKLYNPSTNTATCALNAKGNNNKLYYPLDNTIVRFIAYYPYSTLATLTSCPVKIQTTQNATNMKGFDVIRYKDITAAGQFRRSSAQPSLAFTHEMSKIEVNVTLSSPEMDGISNLVVSVIDIPTEATLNLTTGAYSAWKTKGNVSLSGTTAAEGIIIPHNGATYTGRKLRFTFTDPLAVAPATTSTLDYDIPNTTNYASNTVYVYKVKLTRKGVIFNGCTINPWKNTGSTGGDITLGNGSNV